MTIVRQPDTPALHCAKKQQAYRSITKYRVAVDLNKFRDVRLYGGLLTMLALVLLSGCATARNLGEAAAAARRQQNDLQARATMAAVCDIPVAAYHRALDARDRQAVDLICAPPLAVVLPERLPERLVTP
jgi:hypothetical protein